MLEQKRREFTSVLKEYYSDQRNKIEFDRNQVNKLYDKIQKMHLEFEKIEYQLEQTSYEEFFRLMTSKNKEVNELQQANIHLMKSANQFEKS